MDLLDQATSSEGLVGAKNSEQRDLLFGRVFGYTALVQSGLAMRTRNTTALDLERLIKGLVEHADTKPYLREWCFEVLLSIVQKACCVLY
jgi:hypothetical protein